MRVNTQKLISDSLSAPFKSSWTILLALLGKRNVYCWFALCTASHGLPNLHLTALLWLTEKINNLQNELKSGGLRRSRKWSDHKALSAHNHAYNKKRSAHLLMLMYVVNYDIYMMMMMGVKYFHQPMRAHALLPQASCSITDTLWLKWDYHISWHV